MKNLLKILIWFALIFIIGLGSINLYIIMKTYIIWFNPLNINPNSLLYFFLEFGIFLSPIVGILAFFELFSMYTSYKKKKSVKKSILQEDIKRVKKENYNNEIMNITERKKHNYYKGVKV